MVGPLPLLASTLGLTLLVSGAALPSSSSPHADILRHPTINSTTSSDDLSPRAAAAQKALTPGQQADGLLSNAPPPPKLSAAGVTNFQLIAINEQFEVAFFTSLIQNISMGVPGYDRWMSRARLSEVLDILTTVKAQEDLHAQTAVTTLQHFNASLVPQPCQYRFPTTSMEEAIDLAATFTSVVLGTLQDAQESFAENGDAGAVRAIGSVIGQEGEQNGFYRFILNRKPSEKPFLTTSTAAYAFSALKGFIVSCPFNLDDVPIPSFPPLQLVGMNGPIQPVDQTLRFMVDLSPGKFVGGSSSNAPAATPGQNPQAPGPPPVNINAPATQLFVTYLVGQQTPISVPAQNVVQMGNVLTLEAAFPFAANQMDGLTIAALTRRDGFAKADDMPEATVAAPALIQVNDFFNTGGR